MRKKALKAFFLILFLLSACSKPCHQWELITVKADCPPVLFSKIFLPAVNNFNGIETEFLSTGHDVQLYFNARTLEFPTNPRNPSLTDVTFTIDGHQYQTQAERFEGGQRLLLPESAQQPIIFALMGGCTVDVNIGRYQATLIPDNFSCIYNQIQ